MFNVTSINNVFELINKNFAKFHLEKEMLDLFDAVGRVTSEEIISNEDIPGFNRSLVDGYAVIAQDTNGASESIPAQLELIGEVRMGEKSSFDIKNGQAVYVPTGGEVPNGADAVVMIEYTENLDDGYIYIDKPVAPGNKLVFKGDDAKAKAPVIKANHKLRPQDIGVLAALGYDKVPVKRKLKVGIISTGDELVDVTEEATGAKVRDVNTYFIYAEVINNNAEPVPYGIIRDGYDKIRNTMEQAVNECDLIVVSGGSSVGQKDESYKVISSLDNCTMLVHGIAIKPGKPTILANVGGKPVIGLPGHPVSAYFIYKLIVQHIFDVMNGIVRDFQPHISAEMACNYPSNNGREEFLPVKIEAVNGKHIAHPIFGKSGLITLLAGADGYVQIGRGLEGLMTGQKVDVILF